MAIKNKIKHYLLWKRHAANRAKLTRQHPLKYLFMEVTRRCNLACIYCGSSCTGKTWEGELSTPEWIEIAQQIAADFHAPDIMVAVTGGEPLIKEGIFDLFHELKRLGYRYGMVTNGQVLTPEMAKELIKAGIGSISVSMDALPEINDKLRGKGSSAGIASAIRNLHAAGFRGKLEIISTITAPALADMDKMRSYISSMKVPMWRMAPVIPIGRAVDHPELIPDSTGVRYLLEYIRAARQDSFLPKPEFSEEGFLGYRFEGTVRPYLCQCNAGISVGGIRYNGRIGACPELAECFDQGDIREERFKTVWEEKYQNMRDRSWARRGECADCDHWSICRGGGLHLYNETGGEFARCFYLMNKETERAPSAAPAADATWFPTDEA